MKKSTDSALKSPKRRQLQENLGQGIKRRYQNFYRNRLIRPHDYLDTVTTNNIIPVQILPTRITSKSSTLIDHIYYYEDKLHKESKIKCGNFWVIF